VNAKEFCPLLYLIALRTLLLSIIKYCTSLSFWNPQHLHDLQNGFTVTNYSPMSPLECLLVCELSALIEPQVLKPLLTKSSNPYNNWSHCLSEAYKEAYRHIQTNHQTTHLQIIPLMPSLLLTRQTQTTQPPLMDQKIATNKRCNSAFLTS